MNYSETIKKSETNQVMEGFSKRICCSKVTKVTNENGDFLKYNYDSKNELLTVFSGDFKLLTVEYTG